jgi:hypothetical protein
LEEPCDSGGRIPHVLPPAGPALAKARTVAAAPWRSARRRATSPPSGSHQSRATSLGSRNRTCGGLSGRPLGGLPLPRRERSSPRLGTPPAVQASPVAQTRVPLRQGRPARGSRRDRPADREGGRDRRGRRRVPRDARGPAGPLRRQRDLDPRRPVAAEHGFDPVERVADHRQAAAGATRERPASPG